MGDRDLVVPVAATGAHVTVVSDATGSSRFSRHADGWLRDPRPDQDALVRSLVEAGRRATGPTVLFYQQDDDLLLVSRRRAELAAALAFSVPSAELVEQLVDKSAFTELALRRALPLPPTVIAGYADAPWRRSGLDFPLLVKPLRRTRSWDAVSSSKAAVVGSPDELERLLERLAADDAQVVLQEPVPGPESRIESYHVYVDDRGDVAAEFTGRKIRTYPRELGHSTAVETSEAPDVARLGRSVIADLGLRGVAKVDFKRDPDGRLWLLEVNPRFNLWHHVGAVAGVNIPAVVWADLTGTPRPARRTARPGVRWSRLELDVRAARQEGVGLGSWLRWALRTEIRSTLDPADPLPLVTGRVLAPLGRRVRRSLPGGRRPS